MADDKLEPRVILAEGKHLSICEMAVGVYGIGTNNCTAWSIKLVTSQTFSSGSKRQLSKFMSAMS